jgi:DNA polymerase-4
MPRWIAHVDMDAFFVGVELLRRPELRGSPVIVATGTDPTARGVVMAASYEARAFGVHSALPLAIAHRRCPNAILIPRDMKRYREVSRVVMALLEGYSDLVEVAGLDEAYLDLSDHPLPKSAGRRIKHEVKNETGLTCSVGLAPNKLLAKIASDLDKPDGFCVLRPEELLDAVGDRPASLLPGVGPKTLERLSAMRIATVADVARADTAALERAFGARLGRSLKERAHGIDDRRLERERKPKSESRETTFPSDIDDRAVLNETLDRLAKDVCDGLHSIGYAGRTVTLKLRLRPFRSYTRSRTLKGPTADFEVVRSLARSLLERFELDAPVRLLGVGVSGLSPIEAGAASSGECAPEELIFELG